jgi:hypothetical protein
MTTYVTTSLGEMIKNKIIPAEERAKIVQATAFEVDKELRATDARRSDKLSDDFVNFNFHKSWRTGNVPKNAVIGVDYDYYGAVVKDLLSLWDQWVPNVFDPDYQGRWWFGSASKGYKDSLGIWQNRKEINFETPLEGPQIDVGPKVDYGLFLESWNTRFKYPNPAIAMLQQIGIIHAIARQLQVRWLGVHHIYATAIKPDTLSGVSKRNHREGKDVELFPIIRIQSRHQ